MSDKVLVRKQNETPPPDAFINPENRGQGNTVGLSGGGQGAFLNVDPNRPNLANYSKPKRYAGTALRGALAGLSGISALSRFSGSDEDAVSAAGNLAQDAYTTYGTTAGAERAILGPEPEKPKEVGVAQSTVNDDNEIDYMGMPVNRDKASSTVKPVEHSMEEAAPAEAANPVKVVDSNKQMTLNDFPITPERAKYTGEITESQ